MHHLSNCVHDIASDFIPPPSFLPPVRVPVQNFARQARKYLLDLLFTRTHTRALRVIDARQNIREPLCGHVFRVSYGQSDFWGPTKAERSYPSAIMSRLSPTESDVAKWP